MENILAQTCYLQYQQQNPFWNKNFDSKKHDSRSQ